MNYFRFTTAFLILCFFSIYNAVHASNIYVIGSESSLPAYNKKLPVKIRITDRPTYSAYVLVSIHSTSAMHGYCTNYPVNSTNTGSDLKLLKVDNPGRQWVDLGTGVLRYNLPNSYSQNAVEFTVYVRCYDYGAYGKLKAVVYGNKGQGMKKQDEDISTVPRDENSNHIADGWMNDFYPYIYSDVANEQVNISRTMAQPVVQNYPYRIPAGSTRANSVDKETGPPGNSENGDAYTVFEEYRGFTTRVAQGHLRGSPYGKDVFCVVNSNISTYGTGNSGRHPSIGIITMHKACISQPFTEVWNSNHIGFRGNVSSAVGLVNTNSDNVPDTVNAYAIRIRDSRSMPGWTLASPRHVYGKAATTKPSKFSLINIYVNTITLRRPLVLPNYTLKQIIDHVIGHEVGHTFNLRHCSTNCIASNKKCMMDKITGKFSIGASPSTDHYIDYDLADPVRNPQAPDAGNRTIESPVLADNPNSVSPTHSLVPSNGSYKAEAGSTHISNLTTSIVYSSIYWHVKDPSDTSDNGVVQKIVSGDRYSTTSYLKYTFDSGVSGQYIITAYVYYPSNDVYSTSYTVNVTSSITASPENEQ